MNITEINISYQGSYSSVEKSVSLQKPMWVKQNKNINT